ncbi:MAG: hypothetical protein KDC34_10015 [Saprospiraceae bacterium]|nr:hypothetical protein [Saprospiraceae bacterium]
MKMTGGTFTRTSLSILFLSLGFNFQAAGQIGDSLELLFSKAIEAEDLYVDAFENIYLLDDDNTLRKMESSGSFRFEFRDQRLGDLGFVDLSSPLDILLFYPEFQELVLLDRTLSEVARMRLTAVGFFGIEVVGQASDNKLWIYDPMEGILKKINFDGVTLLESGVLPLLIGKSVTPQYILEQDQKVYVQCAEAGILVFDVFGKFLEQIPWEKGLSLQIVQDLYFGCTGSSCLFMDAFSRREWRFDLPLHSAKALKTWYRGGKLFVLYPGALQVYHLQK